jgi:hypothetical protein
VTIMRTVVRLTVQEGWQPQNGDRHDYDLEAYSDAARDDPIMMILVVMMMVVSDDLFSSPCVTRMIWGSHLHDDAGDDVLEGSAQVDQLPQARVHDRVDPVVHLPKGSRRQPGLAHIWPRLQMGPGPAYQHCPCIAAKDHTATSQTKN